MEQKSLSYFATGIRGWEKGIQGKCLAHLEKIKIGIIAHTSSNISSLAMDYLFNRPGNEGIATPMYYCNFRHQQEQTTTSIVGAILKQLVVRDGVLEGVQYASRYWGKHITREKLNM